ncbi:MAG: ArsR/SmtB family transcription factor, partial [Halobacteriales archaeon]
YMTGNADTSESSTLSPDDAFGVLGNETRIEILRALGDADGPLSFSELHDRVGTRDSGQFNYHLERLTGHFVRKAEDGYVLRRAGRRVIEAVLSGALTDDPTLERTRPEESCWRCGAPIEINWNAGSVEMYCTECAGRYERRHDDGSRGDTVGEGYLGRLPFPPAGLENRAPGEILRTAWTWGNLEILSMSSGICPRCSATVEETIHVCETHDAGDGLCDSCGGRYAAGISFACTNCVFDAGAGFAIALISHTALLSFITSHGLNPISPDSVRRINEVHADYEEEIISTDPLEARFTFHIDDDALTLTVEGTTVTDTDCSRL